MKLYFLSYFKEKYSFLKQGNLVTFYKFDISKKNREIFRKSGLMASRPGFRKRAWTKNHSLARRSLPQRQTFSREPQLDPHSLLCRLMKQPEVSSLG